MWIWYEVNGLPVLRDLSNGNSIKIRPYQKDFGVDPQLYFSVCPDRENDRPRKFLLLSSSKEHLIREMEKMAAELNAHPVPYFTPEGDE